MHLHPLDLQPIRQHKCPTSEANFSQKLPVPDVTTINTKGQYSSSRIVLAALCVYNLQKGI